MKDYAIETLERIHEPLPRGIPIVLGRAAPFRLRLAQLVQKFCLDLLPSFRLMRSATVHSVPAFLQGRGWPAGLGGLSSSWVQSDYTMDARIPRHGIAAKMKLPPRISTFCRTAASPVSASKSASPTGPRENLSNRDWHGGAQSLFAGVRTRVEPPRS